MYCCCRNCYRNLPRAQFHECRPSLYLLLSFDNLLFPSFQIFFNRIQWWLPGGTSGDRFIFQMRWLEMFHEVINLSRQCFFGGEVVGHSSFVTTISSFWYKLPNISVWYIFKFREMCKNSHRAFIELLKELGFFLFLSLPFKSILRRGISSEAFHHKRTQNGRIRVTKIGEFMFDVCGEHKAQEMIIGVCKTSNLSLKHVKFSYFCQVDTKTNAKTDKEKKPKKLSSFSELNILV